MGYRNAEEVLPVELVEQIQEYVEGQSLYIPKRGEGKEAWGTKTGTKEILNKRNAEIYAAYLAGARVTDLAGEYYLTEKSIQRIIRNMKK